MIASGTPREVAILESSSAIERSGQTIDIDAEEVKDKKKPKSQDKLPKNGEKKKLSPSESSKAKLDAARKKIADARKLEMMRRNKNVIRNTAADVITKTSYSKANTQTIDSKEGGATATGKAAANVAKTGVAATKNVAKGLAKAVVGTRNLKRSLSDRAYKKYLYKVEKGKMKEEFIQEVEDKKDSKAKKVIDIMKGKNSVKINPDMKEDTVVIQDASGKDSIEIVDIISSQKIRSDWRKEINVTEASAAWQRKEGKSKSGGLNEKGRKSYERQNPGSDLKAPSKKVGNKRRASFCARMKGMKKKLTSAKTARDPNSRINKSLRAWNC